MAVHRIDAPLVPSHWRPSAAYFYTLDLDGPLLAWEYLRRHPLYRADWMRRRTMIPARWGLRKRRGPAAGRPRGAAAVGDRRR